MASRLKTLIARLLYLEVRRIGSYKLDQYPEPQPAEFGFPQNILFIETPGTKTSFLIDFQDGSTYQVEVTQIQPPTI